MQITKNPDSDFTIEPPQVEEEKAKPYNFLDSPIVRALSTVFSFFKAPGGMNDKMMGYPVSISIKQQLKERVQLQDNDRIYNIPMSINEEKVLIKDENDDVPSASDAQVSQDVDKTTDEEATVANAQEAS